MFKFDVGIEIGTTNTKVCFKNNSLLLNIPSVVAIKKNSNKIVGIGKKAYKMLGRAPDTIIVKKTISKGIIRDFYLNKLLLKEIILKYYSKSLKKCKICICFHEFMSNFEKLVFKNSIFSSKEENIYLIEESLASAIGIGINIIGKNNFLIVNFGGGTTDIAIIGPEGIIANQSIQIGSELIDEIICKNISKNHNLLIGKVSAEKIKKKAITTYNPSTNLEFEIKGKDIISGLPRTLYLSQKEICKNINSPIEKILDSIINIINMTSNKIATEIYENGIILTGGGCLVSGFKETIRNRLKTNVYIAKNAVNCAAYGALNSSVLLNYELANFIIPA